MKITSAFLSAIIGLTFSQSASSASLQSFSTENDRITKAVNCQHAKLTPASYGMGALYGCLHGRAETVKLFVNEQAGTGKVKNIKFMWNDWYKDVGDGIHADKREAQKSLKALLKLYIPNKSGEIEKYFWANKNKTTVVDGLVFEYTYSRGTAIDERLIVITSSR